MPPLDEAYPAVTSALASCTARATDEAQHAVIARVLGSWVFVCCSSDNRTEPTTPEELTLLAGLVPAWLTGASCLRALVLNSGSPDVCTSVSLVFC